MVEERQNAIRSLPIRQLTAEFLMLEMLVICLHVLAARLEKQLDLKVVQN